jgi:hypothetical protein
MAEKDKDVVIIEASALLVTLIFIVLTFYTTFYGQYYAMFQQQNPSKLTEVMIAFASLITAYEQWFYLVGVFFLAAALTATLHLFDVGPDWFLRGLSYVELTLFAAGLWTLGATFWAISHGADNMLANAVALVVVISLIWLPIAYLQRKKRQDQVTREV